MQILDPNGYAAFPGVYHINSRAARAYANRRLNDPPRSGQALPHFRRRTWETEGYRIAPAPIKERPVDGRPPAPGHVCRVPLQFDLPLAERRALSYEDQCRKDAAARWPDRWNLTGSRK